MSLADDMLAVLFTLKEMQEYYDYLVKEYSTTQIIAVFALAEQDDSRIKLYELTEKLYAALLPCVETQGGIKFACYVDWYLYDHLNWSFNNKLVPSWNRFVNEYPSVVNDVFQSNTSGYDADDEQLNNFMKLVKNPTIAKLLLFKLTQ